MNNDEVYNGSITILINERGATIEIYDNISRECIVKATLNLEQLGQSLGRLVRTKCTLHVGELDRVGKKQLIDKFEFEMPLYTFNTRKQIAIEAVEKLCPVGWTPDLYFGAQDSFFSRDDK